MKRHALLITVGIIGLLTISAGVTVATDHLPEDQDIDFDPPDEPDSPGLYTPNAGDDSLKNGNVTAVIEASEVTTNHLDEIENLGASIQSRYEQHLQVEIEAGASPTYSDLPWVEEIRRPYRSSSNVVSEGVGVINADDLHANGITGQNVKVGVIDGGGFDLSSSEISSNVAGHKSFKSSDNIGDGRDHGTATAEVVVDVAPDAELYVANFDTGIEYANAVDWMRNQNVDVIVVSMSFFEQPYDGDGFISNVADDAVQQEGIVWANSAGNYAKAHWQGSFSNPDGDQWLDFASGDDEANYLNGGEPLNADDHVWITLNWDDWDQSDQDYDLHLIKASDDSVVASSTNSQTGSQRPTESIRTSVPEDGKYYAAIEIDDATAPQDLEMFFIREGSTPEHNVAEGSVTAPAVGDSVISVGAFFYGDGSLEDFSSHGPTNDGRTGIDVVAPDGVSNDAFGPYFGTSAAAPHVGGAAVLMLADETSLSPQDVEQRLESTATDIRDPGEDIESGYGKVDVLAAVQQNQAPSASFTFSPSNPDTSDTISFDGSGSSDSDGTIQTYEWDFNGDGTTDETGQTASHSYSNSGTYTVELTVTDDDGGTDTDTATVTVQESANFDVSIDSTNSPVIEGNTLTVDARIENTGVISDTQTVSVSISGLGTDSTSVSLNGGDSTTETFSVDTDSGDAGDYTAGVSSEDDSDSVSVTVNEDNEDPTVSLGDTSVQEGGSTTITANANDPDGDSLSYQWSATEGSISGSGPSVTYNAPSDASAGPDTVTVEVTDGNGGSDSDTATITISEDNQPPTADAGGPYEVDEGSSVNLDASGSFDPDGSIQSTLWQVTGGPGSMSGSTYNAPDEVSSDTDATVELTVTDNDGLTDTDTATVTVRNDILPPTASFTFSPGDPEVDETITFDGTGSSDPDGSIQTYEWDFGDGTTTTGQTISHSYSSPGDYTVKLTVIDNDGATDTTTQTVSVSEENSPPTASFVFSPSSPDTSNIISFDGSGSSDTDGSIQSYSWDFNDGATATGQTATHSYTSSGSYTVELTVTDNDGATDTASQTVSVSGGGDATVESSSVSIDGAGETGESSVTIDAEDGVTIANVKISIDTSIAEIASVEPGADVDTSSQAVTFNVVDQTTDSVRVEYNNIGADDGSVSDFELAVVGLEAQTNDGDTAVEIMPDGVFDGNSNEYGPVDTEEGTLSVNAEPAEYRLSNLNPADATVDEGNDIDISVDVENVGEVGGEQDIDLNVENASETVFTDTVLDVQLPPGGSTTVTFAGVPVGDLSLGEYNHVVSSENETVEGNLTVESASVFQDPLPGFDSPPTNTQELDPTLYEDIDGDGEGLNPTEAVLFWDELVQNPEGFNDLTQQQIDALDWKDDSTLKPSDAVILWSKKVRESASS